MPKILADEECELCLGTGWQTEPPTVVGQNEDGTDILSEPRISMCRCALVKSEDEEEEEDFDDEGMDDDDEDGPVSPYNFGGSLVLAH